MSEPAFSLAKDLKPASVLTCPLFERKEPFPPFYPLPTDLHRLLHLVSCSPTPCEALRRTMPRASTSAYTLDSPGFRKSTPRRAAAQRASTSIASTSAQLLQTAIELNGKGKERAATQDGGGPFETAPKLARGRTGREGKRGTEDQQEKPSKRRKVTADRPSDAPVLQDTGSQPSITTKELTPARRRSSQDDGASRPLRKKRTKKHVRIAQHAAADPSDGETSAYQPSAASDSDSDDAVVSRPIGRALANSTAAALAAPDDSIDWADPLSIPTAQPFRSRRYWQWLELGICTSAVHDVARDESHLGRTLVEWELLRQHRASEEALARTAQPREDEEGQNGSLRAGSAALDTPNGSRVGTPDPPAEEEKDEQDDATPRPTKRPRRRRADISLPSHDPNRALTPFPITRASAEQLEVDEDGVNLLPLPSAVALAKMARWPVHSSLVQPPSEEEGEVEVAQPDALEEALLAQYERFARLRNAATLPALAPPRTARAPSAYAPGGPFERRQDAEMQDDSGTGPDSDSSDELDNLENDDDLLLEPESLPRSMTSIPPTIDKVLLRLLDLVPKAPLPAYDYWTQKTRTEELLKDDKRRGFVRDECAPGWEEVLAIAREMELPAQ